MKFLESLKRAIKEQNDVRRKIVKPPQRIPYIAVWTKGIPPKIDTVKLTIETTCWPNQPIDEPDLIDLLQVLRRSGWTKI